MNRLRLLAAGVIACGMVACGVQGDRITVYTHCGIGYFAIPYEGMWWTFVEGHGNNPPPGWDFNEDVVTVLSLEGDSLTVLGPDGIEWELHQTEPALHPTGGCI